MKYKLLENINNKIILNHNTEPKNIKNIIANGLKADAGKEQGRGLDGNFVWATTEEGKGYGGVTIQFEVDSSVAQQNKVNNTQYTFPFDIPKEDIVNIIIYVTDRYREDEILNKLIPQFGEDKVYNVLSKAKLINNYNLEKLKDLVYNKNTAFIRNDL